MDRFNENLTFFQLNDFVAQVQSFEQILLRDRFVLFRELYFSFQEARYSNVREYEKGMMVQLDHKIFNGTTHFVFCTVIMFLPLFHSCRELYSEKCDLISVIVRLVRNLMRVISDHDNVARDRIGPMEQYVRFLHSSILFVISF